MFERNVEEAKGCILFARRLRRDVFYHSVKETDCNIYATNFGLTNGRKCVKSDIAGLAMPNGENCDATTRLALARARERMRFGRANPRTVVAPIAGRSARTGDDALRLYSDFADGEGLGDAGFGEEAQEADAGALLEGAHARLRYEISRNSPQCFAYCTRLIPRITAGVQSSRGRLVDKCHTKSGARLAAKIIENTTIQRNHNIVANSVLFSVNEPLEKMSVFISDPVEASLTVLVAFHSFKPTTTNAKGKTNA